MDRINPFKKLIEEHGYIVNRLSLDNYLRYCEKMYEHSSNNTDIMKKNEAIYESLDYGREVLKSKVASLWSNPVKERERILIEGHFLLFDLEEVINSFYEYAISLDPHFGKKTAKIISKRKAK